MKRKKTMTIKEEKEKSNENFKTYKQTRKRMTSIQLEKSQAPGDFRILFYLDAVKG